MFYQEKSEKRGVKETACKLILHHLSETTDNSKESQERRSNLVLGSPKYKKTERTGTFKEERQAKEQYRPLKIAFNNEEYLSRSERDLVTEWCCKAKENNKEKDDESFTWKVRGSPRSGLYLIRKYTVHVHKLKFISHFRF